MQTLDYYGHRLIQTAFRDRRGPSTPTTLSLLDSSLVLLKKRSKLSNGDKWKIWSVERVARDCNAGNVSTNDMLKLTGWRTDKLSRLNLSVEVPRKKVKKDGETTRESAFATLESTRKQNSMMKTTFRLLNLSNDESKCIVETIPSVLRWLNDRKMTGHYLCFFSGVTALQPPY